MNFKRSRAQRNRLVGLVVITVSLITTWSVYDYRAAFYALVPTIVGIAYGDDIMGH